jgi:hypothetical protein
MTNLLRWLEQGVSVGGRLRGIQTLMIVMLEAQTLIARPRKLNIYHKPLMCGVPTRGRALNS